MTAPERHRWTLRVRAAADGAVQVFARKSRFDVGTAVEFDEAAELLSSLEYALGALGAELVGGFHRMARARRLSIEHAEAVVQGELNDPLAAIGVEGATGQPWIEWISVKIYVSSSENEAALRAVWDDVLVVSPLLLTLQGVVRIEAALQITP